MLVFQSGYRSAIERSLSGLPIFSTFTRFLHYSNKEESVSQKQSIADKFVSYLETCPDINSLKKLHACIFTFGLRNHILLGSKLLICYANFGNLTESKWVFNNIVNRNLSLWNSILVGYFRSGHFNEVLRLYSNLKHRSIGIDSSTLTFGLKSCIEIGAVQFGKGIHLDAFKCNLQRDRFVGSSLIGFYSKHGHINDARKVFDEIFDRDVVAYTAMITGYAQASDNYSHEAFRVAGLMQKEGLDPNRVTLISLLQAAAKLEALEQGRAIHGYAIRRGIDAFDEILETSLMDMYSKCGALKMSESVFSGMNKRTIGSWNALIAAHIQMGKPFEALDLFHFMLQEVILPDLFTLANMLLGCADLKFLRLGKSIHGYILRKEVQLDVVANTALIDMYSKCNSVNQARKLFDGIETQDLIMFNVMIAGYLQTGSADKAIETFYGMSKAGIKPNPATILSLLSASVDLRDIRKGKQVHGYIVKQGLESNIEISNQVLYMYAKCRQIDIAREIFNRISRRDLVSWTSMITGYVHHGFADEAITLFRLMQEESIPLDSVTVISLLQACSQLGCLKLAKEVHGYIYRIQLQKEISIINSLLTTYAKSGSLGSARILFDSTAKTSLISWNTMISALGMHGNCLEALGLFDMMQVRGFEPDELTFTSILSACSHGGYVEEGLRIFQSMIEQHSMIPNKDHYSCVVDLLSRSGRLEEAYDFMQHLLPTERTSALGCLLSSCRLHRNFKMGEIVGRELLDLDPQNSTTYTLMSNIYAEAGNWDEVARTRKIANGLTRQPGYSMIELNQQVCGI